MSDQKTEAAAGSGYAGPAGSQFPFAALRQAKICMAEVVDKCITNAIAAQDQYSKWASQERATSIRADIENIEKLELDWCNGVISANYGNTTWGTAYTFEHDGHLFISQYPNAMIHHPDCPCIKGRFEDPESSVTE